MTSKIIDMPHSALKKYYGFDNFRDGQKEIIDNVMKGSDGLAIMTTGGGKSLCYQIPALCKSGTAVVISPLISLMKDQVDALQKRGVEVSFINSSIPFEESIHRMQKLRNGDYKIIYVAPERLQNEDMKEALKQIEISFVAVDESHCVSVWGNDFRPSYLDISKNLKEIEDAQGERIQRFAYTATATPEVRKEITEALEMESPYVQVGKFDRANIEFDVKQSKNKVSDLNELLHLHKGEPKIIYTATVKQAESLKKLLAERGMSVDLYHGRLDDEVKDKVQDDFINGNIETIIATNAFGMGVDKSDVRVVIHYHMPQNLENYFQEAGRAGRDGKESKAYLLYSRKDRGLQEFFIDSSYPAVGTVEAVRATIVALADGSGPINLDYEQIALASPTPVETYQVESIINILESQGVLKSHAIEGMRDCKGIEIIDPNVALKLDYLAERKAIVVQNLNTMQRYSETRTCRRRFILKYFGESHPHKNCGSCDVCLQRTITQDKSDKFDKDQVKSALKLISETKGRLHSSRMADILMGVNSKSIERRGHHQLDSFGALKSFSKGQVATLFKSLMEDGFIFVSKQAQEVRLTEKGTLTLNASAAIPNASGATPFDEIEEKRPEVKVTKTRQIFDAELYREICGLRTLIASESRRPVHMVFNDTIAKNFATVKPQTNDELVACGLTSNRTRVFGGKIIDLIQTHIKELDKEKVNNLDLAL